MKTKVVLLIIMSVVQQVVAMQDPQISVLFAGGERHDYPCSTLRQFKTVATLLGDDSDGDDCSSVSLQEIKKEHFDLLLRMIDAPDRIKKQGIVQAEMVHAQPESLIQLCNAAEYLQPNDDNTTRRLMALDYVRYNNVLLDSSQDESAGAGSLQKLCDDQRDTMKRLTCRFVEVVADTTGYYPPQEVRDGVRQVMENQSMVALLSNDEADLLMQGIIRRVKGGGTLRGMPTLIDLIREYVFGNQYSKKLYPAVPYARSITVMVDGQEKIEKVPGEGHFPLTFQDLIDANAVIKSCCGTEVDGRWSSLNSLVGLSSLSDKEAWKKLDFQHNNIQELPAKIFAGFCGLRSLSLIYNNLEQMHKDAFVCLPNLEELDLSDNKISDFPKGIFRDLSKLAELNVSNNKIQILPEEMFRDLSNLQKLILSYNKIQKLSVGAFTGLTKLEILDLYDNQISALPEKIFTGLACLQKLDLVNNQLKELSAGICAGLTRLQKFHVANNQLNSLPVGIFADLIQLQSLALSGNELKVLPPLTELVRLQELYVERNQITQTEVQIRADNPQLPGTCKIYLKSVFDESELDGAS